MNAIALLALAAAVSGHGFMTIPPARQVLCNHDGGFWWPTDGSAIPNDMCRDAYQFVAMISDYTAAQSMFTQINEYAALAGPDYSWEAIKDHVVGKDLCGANSTSKSGMALVGDWQTTKVSTSEFEFEFCATATHYPSIFRIYITDYNFNVKTDELSWDRLSLVSEHINPLPVDAVSFLCTSPTAYRFPITLPYRRQGIIYVWWQRQDAAGEGFYNCVDFTMNLFKD